MAKMSRWVPISDPRVLRRLGKLLEELGELVAACGRAIIQGLDGIDPASGETNTLRISKETADVMAQISCTVNALTLDEGFIIGRTEDKIRQMDEWEALCPCEDRPADECPGEWEQGCDLGANEKFVKRVTHELEDQVNTALKL